MSIAKIAARGAALLIANTIVSKVVTLAGQIILARLLLPESWGVFTLAVAVSGFASLVGQIGIGQVLIHRYDELDLWRPTALCLTLIGGAIAASGVVIAAPFWADVMNDDRIIPVMRLLSVEVLLGSLAVTPSAILRSQFRFRAVASIGFVCAITQTGLAILLAYFGFAEIALAISKVVAALLQLVGSWYLVGHRVTLKFEPNRAFSMLKDGAPVMLAGVAFTATLEGDNVILGLLTDPKTVGLYAFAFNLSTQVTSLITQNVQSVLMPALTKAKNDSALQLRQAQRASRLLALLVLPFCCAISVAAEPLVRLVFGQRWLEAVPILQILGPAAAFRVIAGPSAVLLLASGHFSLYVRLHLFSATIFLAIVAFAVSLEGAIGAALGVLAHAIVAVAIFSYSGNLTFRVGIVSIGRSIGAPLVASLIASVIAVWAETLGAKAYIGLSPDVVSLAIIVVTGGLVYVTIAYLIAREDCMDLTNIARSVLERKAESQ